MKTMKVYGLILMLLSGFLTLYFQGSRATPLIACLLFVSLFLLLPFTPNDKDIFCNGCGKIKKGDQNE